VLSAEHRLTSSQHFAEAVRRGRRAGTATLVVHLAAGVGARPGAGPAGPRVGFVVSKAVGNAVTRNRVKRRLRHLVRQRLASSPISGVLVVRALPASATRGYADLGNDLDAALERATGGNGR
jgi:ribonuclease P protein component